MNKLKGIALKRPCFSKFTVLNEFENNYRKHIYFPFSFLYCLKSFKIISKATCFFYSIKYNNDFD